MKKNSFLLLIFLLMLSNVCTLNVSAASKKETYSLYKEWLNSKEGKQYDGFALVKIDKDDVCELVAHRVNALSYLDEYLILTNVNGTLVSESIADGVASAGGYRGSYSFIPKKGKMYQYSWSSGTGEKYHSVYTFKKGKINEIHCGTETYNPYPKVKYQWNNKTVSKKKFKASLKKAINTKKTKAFNQLHYRNRTKIKKAIR